MYSRQTMRRVVSAVFPLILCIGAVGHAQFEEDDVPEITARVARVTVVSGDVKVRRAGNEDWEKVTADLPVVEGDEIVTGGNTQAEIQLDSNGYLRMDSDTVVTVSTLKDEGVALSLPQGTINIRVFDFDKDRSYLEIDAPKSTIAIQRSGSYRIDAGGSNDQKIRVSATESGEARVYSENSGFTLKNNRSSTINIAGDLAGEWETTEASNFHDSFDTWASDQDKKITDKLNNAYYDKYYDRDIYGAEDLTGYGDWVHLKDYGYVWRPSSSATGNYADWSPYRYGEWRWVPPFGWTWVNDEPWGWATYHHGRWFYESGSWYWAPYGYYRNARSWWSPALVVLTALNDDYYWYPSSYYSSYYDCNWYSHHHGRYHGIHHGQHNGYPGGNAAPSPTPITGRGRLDQMPYFNVPVSGVVAATKIGFGTGKGQFKKATPDIAKSVLTKNPDEEATMPRLPKFDEVISKAGGRIRADKPAVTTAAKEIATGATVRNGGRPLDDELRIDRVMDKRPPSSSKPSVKNSGRVEKGGTVMRDTGAIGRAPRNTDDTEKREPKERDTKRQDGSKGNDNSSRNDSPGRSVEPRQSQPKDSSRNDSPRQSTPKQETPRSESPRQEQPRNDSPKQSTPKSDSPSKSEPKQESKPSSSPSDTGRKKG